MGIVYWSIVALALGACIGSFLNVVIYRWPLGLSIRQPARSFCPACSRPIAWYDNIPVLSFLALRGRCRQCGAAISIQYPLVEVATALAFLICYDAFFVARLRLGITGGPEDAVILAMHWALFAGLIVLAVMDLEAYMVDIRVTWLVSLAGVLGHCAWTPLSSQAWIRPGAFQCGLVWAALLGLALAGWWMLRCREPASEETSADGPETAPVEADTPPTPARTWQWIWLVLPMVGLGLYVVLMRSGGPSWFAPALVAPSVFEPPQFHWDPGAVRVAGGLVALFVALTLTASRPRAEADEYIIEAIESEAPESRAMALRELKWLSPAILLAVGAGLVLTNLPPVKEAVSGLLAWRAYADWRPFLGVSTGLAGWIIGGAVGWSARIIFTLLFGKEALGMGDVHILAAAGAVAGWPVALLGFFLGAMLALAGLVVIRLRRQSRALPYGPWLGLGFFLAAMFQDRFLAYLNVRWLFE